jgi:FixJ family two-component response regulator
VIEPPKAIVAVVDDDFAVLVSLEDLLRSDAYAVRPFPSGTAFLESGAIGSVDCVITDVSMPGLTGLELERQVRLERPALPVALITGQESTWKQAQGVARAVRLRSLFKKPLDDVALLAAIRIHTSASLGGRHEVGAKTC